ncbi:MAG: oligosaccharide flippase family protein [Spirochaetaceae bacterium]|nr:oligosaccharide flippase family protein [Spirochaetaceae bacterium]
MQKNTKKRSITKKSIIYTGGTIIASISMALSTFLYSKYTSPSNYGDFQLTLSIMMLLTTVGFLDIRTSTLRFMYGVGAENELDKKKAIYGGALILFLCSFLLFLSLYIATKITYMPFPKEGLAWGLTYSIGYFYLFVTRGSDRELDYSIGYSIYFAVLVGLNIFFLSFKHYRAEYILLAMSLGEVAQIIYLEIRIGIIRKFKRKYIDKKIIMHMLKFSLPLAITALGTWIMSYYASIQITYILGSSANGIYSMTMDFARAIPTATGGMILAWQEISFARKSDENENVNREFFTNSITTSFIFFSCFFIVFIPLMRLIMPFYLSEEYQPVGLFIALCSAGYVCECIGQVIAGVFGNDIDSKPLMFSTIAGSVFLIVFLPFFVNTYELYGASLVCFISFSITLLVKLLWLRIKKHYRLDILKLSLCLIIATIFGYLSTNGSYTTNIILFFLSLCIAIPMIRFTRKALK